MYFLSGLDPCRRRHDGESKNSRLFSAFGVFGSHRPNWLFCGALLVAASPDLNGRRCRIEVRLEHAFRLPITTAPAMPAACITHCATHTKRYEAKIFPAVLRFA